MLNTVYHKTDKWILILFFRRAITLEKTFLRGSLVTTNPPALILNSASVLKWPRAKSEKSAKKCGPFSCISWPMLTQLTTVCPVGCGLQERKYLDSFSATHIYCGITYDWQFNEWCGKGSTWNVSPEKWVSEPWVWKNEMTWAHGPSFEAWEATSGQRHFVHSVFHAAGTVWCLVWCECQPLWSAGQRRPLLVWNHKCILIEAVDGYRKTPRPCDRAWLYGTVWCRVSSGSQTLLSPGDGGLCCVLWTLFLICSLYLKHPLQSLYNLQSAGMLLDKHLMSLDHKGQSYFITLVICCRLHYNLMCTTSIASQWSKNEKEDVNLQTIYSFKVSARLHSSGFTR